MKSIKQKLLAGFGIIIILIILLSAIVHYNVNVFTQTTEEIMEKDSKLIAGLNDLNYSIQTRIALVRGYMLFGEKEYVDRFYKLTEESKQIQEEVLVLSNNNEELKKLIDQSIEWRKMVEEKMLKPYSSGNKELALTVLKTEVTPLGREIDGGFNQLVGKYEALLASSSKSLIERGQSLGNLLLIFSIAAISIGVIISFVIASRISKPIIAVVERLIQISKGDFTGEDLKTKSKDEVGKLVHSVNEMSKSVKDLIKKVNQMAHYVGEVSKDLEKNTERTTQSSQQISTMMAELSSGLERQVSGVEESNTAMEEMAIGIQRIAESSSQVSEASIDTAGAARTGNHNIKEAINQINEIHSSVNDSAKVIQELQQRSEEIANIIEVITGISSQTNLLALNAAIESARAGEHGRGFAVVADEVRKLAEQTDVSAGQITRLIQEMKGETSRVVQSINKVTESVNKGISVIKNTEESFKKIVEATDDVAAQIQEVSAVSEEMSASAEEISASFEETSNIAKNSSSYTQEVVASTEQQLHSMTEVSSSIQSLVTLVTELESELAKFKV